MSGAASQQPPSRIHSESDSAAINDGLSLSFSGCPSPSSSSATRRPLLAPFKHSSSFTFGEGGAKGRWKSQWKAAALKARLLQDPWAGLSLDKIPEEEATRHMYNARSRKWKTDIVVVKIQTEPFAHGAMRECFRMKKLSKFSQHPDWKTASNYVAKRYMKEVERETYFEDVKLQMASKLWGEEYNKMNPPKKVDFFQTYIIELKGRAGSPLYCVEHLIEGKYIKYNSNSGFVSDVNRLTPQAFSHFTFEESDNQLIVVDIQGVGDLYTDPQMHTMDQKDFGEANLGAKGMALFFSSHICSPLCDALGLTQFDLSEKEVKILESQRWNFSSSTTAISSLSHSHSLEDRLSKSSERGSQPNHLHSKLEEDHPHPKETVGEAFRRLSIAMDREALFKQTFSKFSYMAPDSPLPLDSPGITMQIDKRYSIPEEDEQCREGGQGARFACVVECEDGEGGEGGEGGDPPPPSVAVQAVQSAGMGERRGTAVNLLTMPSIKRSASVLLEKSKLGEFLGRLKNLGMVHLELAKYHEIGRFSDDHVPNFDFALFHLNKAADCNIPEALFTVAHVHLQLPHDDFKEIAVEPSPANECVGMEYLTQAAGSGIKAAMFEVAKAYDTGAGLGTANQDDPSYSARQRYQDWTEAVSWYEKSIKASEDGPEDSGSLRGGDVGRIEEHCVLARMAEMYRTGGHRLDQDCQKSGDLYTEAAEAAMNAMKGKMANRYYMLAEEVWSEMPDD